MSDFELTDRGQIHVPMEGEKGFIIFANLGRVGQGYYVATKNLAAPLDYTDTRTWSLSLPGGGSAPVTHTLKCESDYIWHDGKISCVTRDEVGTTKKRSFSYVRGGKAKNCLLVEHATTHSDHANRRSQLFTHATVSDTELDEENVVNSIMEAYMDLCPENEKTSPENDLTKGVHYFIGMLQDLTYRQHENRELTRILDEFSGLIKRL